jgi:hypothetical protein
MRAVSRLSIAVTAVALALTVSACGGSDDSSGTTTTTAGGNNTTTTAAAAKTVGGPCDVLTTDQVASVSGGPVTSAVNNRNALSPVCDFSKGNTVALKVTYTESGVGTAQDILNTLAAGAGTLTPVAGVGDAAVFVKTDPGTDQFIVVKKSGSKTRAVTLRLSDDSAADTKTKLENLAKLAVGNI